ncbi:MAG: peptidase M49 [Acidobacteria bacterium]|nr:peptidase M49 [Acidobacteriota bacterium]
MSRGRGSGATGGSTSVTAPADTRPYLLEQVDDAAIVQLYADGFEALPLREKTLVWHLAQAAIAGRDIYYDQRYAHGLEMRAVLEEVLRHGFALASGVRDEFTRYTKLFWLNTGPHNTLTARKFVMTLDAATFAGALAAVAADGAHLPLGDAETVVQYAARVAPWFLDPDVDAVVTSKTPGEGRDILEASANNLYAGVTLADLDGFDERHPLNSRLVKRDGRLVEEVYRVGGLYGDAIERIVGHLEAAVPYATDAMGAALRALIRWYRTGDEDDRRAYDIAWVADKDSPVDTINGFVEVYLDPRGRKGAWEALVYYTNQEKTRDIEAIARHAPWFEGHMPYADEYRRLDVQGVTARAIDVVIETGDSGPMTPIGINLPNDECIREVQGSKSVSLSNVVLAYDRSLPTEFRREFSWTTEEAERAERWSSLAGELTTNLHEVIGHGSGRLAPRLNGTPQVYLREHYSALEETRADLVALYFVADPVMVELGLLTESYRHEVVQAEYEGYVRNALVQLRRIRTGTLIEEDHMRNRQAIVRWLMAHTSAIDVRRREGKTYWVMTDRDAFREGVGRLLVDVQRMKSEGDYDAARSFFEAYGIHFDAALRDEVVARVDALRLPSYTGFVMPDLAPVYDESGTITDVHISYPLDLTTQMLRYSAATTRR